MERFDTEYEEFMDDYLKKHAVCPECGSRNFSTTLVGFIVNLEHPEEYQDKNSVHCHSCGWKGIRHELVPARTDRVGYLKDVLGKVNQMVHKAEDDKYLSNITKNAVLNYLTEIKSYIEHIAKE